MDETKISWPGWETVRLIGRGSFGTVYEIQRDIFGETEKAALKVISIPQNDSDIDEMYGDGYDTESVTSTFQSHMRSVTAEYSLMRKMNGSSNIVNCDDIKHVQHDDGIGWDIFIKMELLTPLFKVEGLEITEKEVIRVAKDMCAALILCNKHNIVHRDIKPQNIFLSPNGDYKLGDFGIAKTMEKTKFGTKTGTYKYMAPEVYNNQPYGHSADICSLGLVLYWLLNERRTPFIPLPPTTLKAAMEEDARDRRMRGEPLPAPAHGSKELKAIVLKACAYDPAQRYHTAEEMLRDLEKLGGAIVTVPVPEVDPDEERLRKEKEERERKEKEERERKEAEEARRKAKEEARRKAAEEAARRKAEEERLRKEQEETQEKQHNMPQTADKWKRIAAVSLAALWILSVVFAALVWRNIGGYIPYVYNACVIWVYINFLTGWIIPLITLRSLKLTAKRQQIQKYKKICKIAVIIQLVLFACNLLMAFVIIFPEFCYYITPGSLTMLCMYELHWDIQGWSPFIICILARLILLGKDVAALYVATKAEAAQSNTETESDSQEETSWSARAKERSRKRKPENAELQLDLTPEQKAYIEEWDRAREENKEREPIDWFSVAWKLLVGFIVVVILAAMIKGCR